jgi:hypothetical protein
MFTTSAAGYPDGMAAKSRTAKSKAKPASKRKAERVETPTTAYEQKVAARRQALLERRGLR